MAISRKFALKRLNGLAPRVEDHLIKLAANPENREVPHWITETESWLQQMEDVMPHVGKKTSAVWSARITHWRDQLQGFIS